MKTVDMNKVENVVLALILATIGLICWIVAMFALKMITGELTEKMMISAGVCYLIFEIYMACATFGRRGE